MHRFMPAPSTSLRLTLLTVCAMLAFAGNSLLCRVSVPAIAAIGGAMLLAEPITARLLLASAAILGGIALTIRRKG